MDRSESRSYGRSSSNYKLTERKDEHPFDSKNEKDARLIELWKTKTQGPEELATSPGEDDFPITIHGYRELPVTPPLKSGGTTVPIGTKAPVTGSLDSKGVAAEDRARYFAFNASREVDLDPHHAWPLPDDSADPVVPAPKLTPLESVERTVLGDLAKARLKKEGLRQIGKLDLETKAAETKATRTRSLLEFNIALNSERGRAVFLAQSVSSDAGELRNKYAKERLDLLARLTPPRSPASDLILQAYVARANAAETVDREAPGLDSRTRKLRIDGRVRAEMHPATVRQHALAAMRAAGPDRVLQWTTHEDDALHNGPFVRTLLLRSEVLRHLDTMHLPFSQASLILADVIAARMETQGEAASLPEASEERSALMRPTPDDYRRVLRELSPDDNLAALCDEMEEAHVDAGGDRDQIRSNPIHMALSRAASSGRFSGYASTQAARHLRPMK